MPVHVCEQALRSILAAGVAKRYSPGAQVLRLRRLVSFSDHLSRGRHFRRPDSTLRPSAPFELYSVAPKLH